MAQRSPPPAYPEKFIIVLIGQDTQLKSLIGQLLCGSAVSMVTEDGLVVNDDGAFKVVTMPDFGVHQSLHVIDCMALSQPGVNLFILPVDSHHTQSKTPEDEIKELQKCFGNHIIPHLVVMVRDMDSYQKLHPLKDKLGVRLATANENIQQQCKEWCFGPAYNYEQSMNLLLAERKKFLDTQLQRDQQHLQTLQPITGSETVDVGTSTQTKTELEKTAPENNTDVECAEKSEDVFNMILVGQTASGKSASAKTILSTLKYQKVSKNVFKSELKSVPVTTTCEAVILKTLGTKVRIIDTPDFFHDQVKNAESELEWCKKFCQPDRCVVLLVMQAGRFTDGEREILDHLEKRMGWQIRENTVILLTHGENLPMTCDQYINEQPELRNLVSKVNNRCVLFKNTSKDLQQVMELIRKIPDYKMVFPNLTGAITKSTFLFRMATSPLWTALD